VRWKTFTFLYDKFTQDDTYQTSSEWVGFCKRDDNKHYGVFLDSQCRPTCNFSIWICPLNIDTDGSFWHFKNALKFEVRNYVIIYYFRGHAGDATLKECKVSILLPSMLPT